MATAREEVRRLLELLPDDTSLEDVQYSIYVRERIERGRLEANEVEAGGLDEFAMSVAVRHGFRH